jgi:hypothetical protein
VNLSPNESSQHHSGGDLFSGSVRSLSASYFTILFIRFFVTDPSSHPNHQATHLRVGESKPQRVNPNSFWWAPVFRLGWDHLFVYSHTVLANVFTISQSKHTSQSKPIHTSQSQQPDNQATHLELHESKPQRVISTPFWWAPVFRVCQEPVCIFFYYLLFIRFFVTSQSSRLDHQATRLRVGESKPQRVNPNSFWWAPVFRLGWDHLFVYSHTVLANVFTTSESN